MANKYYVYKYYINEELIYVGRTDDILRRHKDHLSSADPNRLIFQNITSVHIAVFNVNADMMLYEKYYITKYHPRCNTVDMQWQQTTIQLPEPQWVICTSKQLEQLRQLRQLKAPKIIKQSDVDAKELNKDISIINLFNTSQESFWENFLNYDLTKTAFLFPNEEKPLMFKLDHKDCAIDVNYIYKNIMYPLLSGQQKILTYPLDTGWNVPWLHLVYDIDGYYIYRSIDDGIRITVQDNENYCFEFKHPSKIYNELYN